MLFQPLTSEAKRFFLSYYKATLWFIGIEWWRCVDMSQSFDTLPHDKLHEQLKLLALRFYHDTVIPNDWNKIWQIIWEPHNTSNRYCGHNVTHFLSSPINTVTISPVTQWLLYWFVSVVAIQSKFFCEWWANNRVGFSNTTGNFSSFFLADSSASRASSRVRLDLPVSEQDHTSLVYNCAFAMYSLCYVKENSLFGQWGWVSWLSHRLW